MELVDVLRHQGEPKIGYFLEIPTPYGKLRLDILGTVETALTQVGLSEEDAHIVAQIVDESRRKLHEGDATGSVDLLLDAARRFPYAARPYGALYDLYQPSNPDKAEYYLKQLIALQPTPDNLLRLGKLLGQTGRFDEALTIQDYLWQRRSQLSSDDAMGAAKDYLITLGRAGDARKMIEVAGQAIVQLGDETALVYQYILAHLLDNQVQAAKERLDAVTPKLDPTDPMYSRFEQLREHIDGLLPKS